MSTLPRTHYLDLIKQYLLLKEQVGILSAKCDAINAMLDPQASCAEDDDCHWADTRCALSPAHRMAASSAYPELKEEDRIIIVQNLDPRITDEMLWWYFNRFGPLRNILKLSSSTALVMFADERDSEVAAEAGLPPLFGPFSTASLLAALR